MSQGTDITDDLQRDRTGDNPMSQVEKLRKDMTPITASTVWICSLCGWKYHSPIPVETVWHKCPKAPKLRHKLTKTTPPK